MRWNLLDALPILPGYVVLFVSIYLNNRKRRKTDDAALSDRLERLDDFDADKP